VRRLLVSTFAVVVAAAGCGGSSEQDYRDDVAPIREKVAKLNRDVLSAARQAPRQSDAQVEKRFGQLAQTAGDTQQDLDTLDPPEDLSDEQEALVEALGNSEDALNAIEKAAGENDVNAARRAAIQLDSSLRGMNGANRRLRDATSD
jgi:uncharacterized protein YukE